MKESIVLKLDYAGSFINSLLFLVKSFAECYEAGNASLLSIDPLKDITRRKEIPLSEVLEKLAENEVLDPVIWFAMPEEPHEVVRLLKTLNFDVSDGEEAFDKAKYYLADSLLCKDNKQAEAQTSYGRFLLWVASCFYNADAIDLYLSELHAFLRAVRTKSRESERLFRSMVPDFADTIAAWTDLHGQLTKSFRLRASHAVIPEEDHASVDALLETLDFDEKPSNKPRLRRRPRTSVATYGGCVLNAVGDAESGDGRNIHKRFSGSVGQILPFKGSMPRSGTFKKAIVNEWPWANKVADTIEIALEMQRSVGVIAPKLKPMLFVGDPGSGKTSLARRVGELLGHKPSLISVGGTSDSASIAASIAAGLDRGHLLRSLPSIKARVPTPA